MVSFCVSENKRLSGCRSYGEHSNKDCSGCDITAQVSCELSNNAHFTVI